MSTQGVNNQGPVFIPKTTSHPPAQGVRAGQTVVPSVLPVTGAQSGEGGINALGGQTINNVGQHASRTLHGHVTMPNVSSAGRRTPPPNPSELEKNLEKVLKSFLASMTPDNSSVITPMVDRIKEALGRLKAMNGNKDDNPATGAAQSARPADTGEQPDSGTATAAGDSTSVGSAGGQDAQVGQTDNAGATESTDLADAPESEPEAEASDSAGEAGGADGAGDAGDAGGPQATGDAGDRGEDRGPQPIEESNKDGKTAAEKTLELLQDQRIQQTLCMLFNRNVFEGAIKEYTELVDQQRKQQIGQP